MPRKKKTDETEAKPAEEESEAETTEEEDEESKETKKGRKKKSEGITKEDIVSKEHEIKKRKDDENMLVPLDDYIKAAAHFGTKAITPGMRQFVYKKRADGIAVLNTKKIDEKIAIAGAFLAKYEPKDIMVCCKREAGHMALESFGNATGAKIFKKYPAGRITNPKLENFFEPKLVLVIDPWLDRNAVMDSVTIRAPVVALCDTNNPTEFVDFIIPCNNKTEKSIGLALYILAKIYLEKRGDKKKLNTDDFYKFEEIPQYEQHAPAQSY
ncbi:MAG: 30S ribosomal protein S2 [Candidatus Paceibacterota bacterium]